MKKSTFFILNAFVFCFGLPYLALSQGWQAGYLFQPQYSSLNQNSVPTGVKIEQNQTFTIYTGLSATYFFTPKIGLGTGVSYGHDSQKFIYQNTYGVSTKSTAHHYVFNMLKVPIEFKYMNKIGKVRLLIDGGPQFCFVLKVTDKTPLGRVDYSDNYATFQIGFHFGTGVGIQVTNQLMVYIKPNFELTNYSFNHTVENINQDLPLGKNISGSSVGLQVGIMWMKSKEETTAK